MKNNLISIVLTLYNKAPYIEETIFSIYKQTYTNWELIIVDDCSTDGSLEIAKSFCEKLGITNKCKFIKNEKNLWVAKTFERWLKEVEWDWVSMCDGDDIMTKDKLEIDLHFCLNNKIDFAYSDLVWIDENNDLLFNSRIRKRTKNPDRLTLYKILSKSHICWTSIFFNKKVFLKLRELDFIENIYQDLFVVIFVYIYWFKIWRIPRSTVYYRRCKNCITYASNSPVSNRQILINWKEIFKKYVKICEYFVKHWFTIDDDLKKFKSVYMFFIGEISFRKIIYLTIKYKWFDMFYPIFIYKIRYIYEWIKKTEK